MKRICNKCHIEQDVAEFYLKYKNKTERHTVCKTCYKIYRQSSAGITSRKKYDISKKGRKNQLEYRKRTREKRRLWFQEYIKSGRHQKAYLVRRFNITAEQMIIR